MLWTFLVAFSMAPGAALGPAPRAGDPRPNIVVLVADDMDYEHFGFAGHPLAPTPTIDALARDGFVFTHGIVPMSRCRPSQASLLSGLWPHQNGVYFNVGADHIDPAVCLPNLLAHAGYATIGEGKFWEYEARQMGFSNLTIRNYETFVRWDQQHLFDWLDEHAHERPFFVWWAPQLPHVPHDPPERLLERFPADAIPVPSWFEGDVAAYRDAERTLLAMDAWLDEGVRTLLDKLEALGVRDDTLFVLYIDNGWSNGTVSKGWAFDKGLRTPVIFSWKKGLAGGGSAADLVSPVDVYATLLDYGHAPIPEHCQGVSLRPRLEGRPFEPRSALYGALYPLQSTENEADATRDAYALWARTERWKYVLSLKDVDASQRVEGEREDVKVLLANDFVRKRGEEELYDLEADPYELKNLAADPAQAEVKTRLRRETLDWWSATGGGALDVP